MRNNKISAVLFFLSIILIVLSFMSISIYNSIKDTIIDRDAAIINELQIALKDIKDDATIKNAAKLKVYSQKIMNIDAAFYEDSGNLSKYSVKLSNLSSDIMKNIDNDKSLPVLLSEYENTLNDMSSILN